MTNPTTELFSLIEQIGATGSAQEVCDQLMTVLKKDPQNTLEYDKEKKPWTDHDPNQRARKMFSLRLNDHDMAILRHLANENEDLSMQKIIRRILVPELRRRVGL